MASDQPKTAAHGLKSGERVLFSFEWKGPMVGRRKEEGLRDLLEKMGFSTRPNLPADSEDMQVAKKESKLLQLKSLTPRVRCQVCV